LDFKTLREHKKQILLLIGALVGFGTVLAWRRQRRQMGINPVGSFTAQPGDIILFCNAGGIARLITWFTKSPYYHVGLYGGGIAVVESRLDGVKRRDLKRLRPGRDFVIIPAPDKIGPRALNWAQLQIGDGYDLDSVLMIVLNRLFQEWKINLKPTRDRFSCSELVLCAFHAAGVELLPGITPDSAVPGDFAVLLPDGCGVSQ
jgi:uncharacterized protein YycO